MIEKHYLQKHNVSWDRQISLCLFMKRKIIKSLIFDIS